MDGIKWKGYGREMGRDVEAMSTSTSTSISVLGGFRPAGTATNLVHPSPSITGGTAVAGESTSSHDLGKFPPSSEVCSPSRSDVT
jgi:hypothetical protein